MTVRRAGAVALATLTALAASVVVTPAVPRAWSAGREDACVVDGRYVMGTILQLELCASDEARRAQGLDDAFATAHHLDALLTTFADDSPVRRLNASAGRGPVALPPEVVEVLAAARSAQHLTRGTFDVTIGPLVALWRDAATSQQLPADESIAAARARVDASRIALGEDGSSAALRDPAMAVDLGGVGKGYALDRIAGRLRAIGIHDALLDFGRSSVWALGHPPDAAAWRLLLQHPSGDTLGVIELRDVALSVSGSLGQSTTIAGRRFGHVVDPRTGWPVTRDLLAAVVAPRAELAEALSKALLILGERDGIALLERLDGVEGLLVEAAGARWATSGWEDATGFTAELDRR